MPRRAGASGKSGQPTARSARWNRDRDFDRDEDFNPDSVMRDLLKIPPAPNLPRKTVQTQRNQHTLRRSISPRRAAPVGQTRGRREEPQRIERDDVSPARPNGVRGGGAARRDSPRRILPETQIRGRPQHRDEGSTSYHAASARSNNPGRNNPVSGTTMPNDPRDRQPQKRAANGTFARETNRQTTNGQQTKEGRLVVPSNRQSRGNKGQDANQRPRRETSHETTRVRENNQMETDSEEEDQDDQYMEVDAEYDREMRAKYGKSTRLMSPG